MIKYNFLILLFFIKINSQTINLNEDFVIDYLRTSQINGDFITNFSFTQRPVNTGSYGIDIEKNVFNTERYSPTIFNFFNSKGKLKILPVNYNIEYNSHHPYNRNNGSMIQNKGYQHLLSAGIYFELGPLTIQFKPEHIFAQNLEFDGFWDGHYDEIWAKRYQLWNKSDIPERYGVNEFNITYSGQSSVKLNHKMLSLGISSENIWWGPSIRNGIMMSNHAKGFNHITFNTNRPLDTSIGSFEWQLVTGKLTPSNKTPPQIDRTYGNTLLYIEKQTQTGKKLDPRFFQGITFTYSPKWIKGLSLGFIRWVQMYNELVEGKYWWLDGNRTYFPLFSNLFRKNDSSVDFETQTDQAAGLFFRWLWKESKTEIYAEYHYNDAKFNLRDLLLDSDHARGATFGLKKIFKSGDNNYIFSWEWTQLEQTAGRVLRNAGSWYAHSWVTGGFTNRGEVVGAGIGPGSNSHFFKISQFKKFNTIGLSFEIIDQDNDFYYYAFENAKDYRRYWKDYNIHLNLRRELNNFLINLNLMYSRSLNYQWQLEDYSQPYYHAGKDVNNFHANIKLIYRIPMIN